MLEESWLSIEDDVLLARSKMDRQCRLHQIVKQHLQFQGLSFVTEKSRMLPSEERRDVTPAEGVLAPWDLIYK